MKNLAKEIEATTVPKGAAALWWLAQAGFVFKSGQGAVFYLDPYLSDIVERAFGFKRLSLAPIDADNARADWMINSHEHLDHLDTDALPVIARNNPRCRFAGATACAPEYARCGIAPERQVILHPNRDYPMDDVTVYTAQADHGELSPSALSLLLDFDGVRVLFTGDTALRVEWLRPLIDRRPDILLPCINGTFGNLDAREAAELTRAAVPRAVIPCHFWMFKEHNGDPETFVQACGKACPGVEVRLLTPGQGILVTSESIQPIPERLDTVEAPRE